MRRQLKLKTYRLMAVRARDLYWKVAQHASRHRRHAASLDNHHLEEESSVLVSRTLRPG